MRTKNIFWIVTGLLNLFTAFIHVIGGQITLINPILKSELTNQIQTEMLGVWHAITVILFASSIAFLGYGFANTKNTRTELIAFLSYLYIAFSIAFIFSSIHGRILAPQWILLLPIGLLGLLGIHKLKRTNERTYN